MDIVMPQLGETLAEGTVTRWHKQVGETVRVDEALFDVETDKVSTEIPSPAAGVLAQVLVPAGQTVKVGTRLAVVRAATGSSVSGSTAAFPAARRDPQQRLSPVVRRLLAEHALDASVVPGTGRDGRVTRGDVLKHVAPGSRAPLPVERIGDARAADSQTDAARAPVPEAPPSPHLLPEPQPRSPLPGAEAPGLREGERVVALNSVRRRSAAAMARAWPVVPHVLQAVEADYSRIEQARRAKQATWQAREGFQLTYLPFLAWAVCQALLRYDQLNARIDGDNLVVSRRVHLGIAVDLDHDGLVVPVIRDAQDRNTRALAREIRRLALGARACKLEPDDYAQPTYTISNSGVFGTLITAPIVNPPQVAILSTDVVRKRPVVVESADGDSIAVRPVGVLAQSFDHRAIDGAYSAAFLQELKRIVETRAWIEDIV
jgi:pyruvate dehydrogenase E2 component (dihydrolipoamide acetyltransferase)